MVVQVRVMVRPTAHRDYNYNSLFFILLLCLELGRLATRPPRGLRELLRDRTPATFPLIYSSLYYYLFIYLFRSSGWVS